VLNLFRDTGTVVGQLHHHTVVGRVSAQRDLAFASQRVHRVVNDIGPHLVYVARVGLDAGQVGGVVADHGDALLKLVAQDDEGVVQPFVDVDLLHRGAVEVRVRLDRLDDLRDAVGARADLVQHTVNTAA